MFLEKVITRPIYGADGKSVDLDVASSTEYDCKEGRTACDQAYCCGPLYI
jgi:hypothetical protein